jgi:phosphoribosylaminoimidazolecarboxamide formyltransferase/IMP cyclohydrolase
MKEFDIPQIDLVIVDLYPLKNSCLRADESDIIEKLILDFFNSLPLKNFKDTVIIASVDEYSLL